MIKQTLPIVLGTLLTCGVAANAEAQLSASGKLEAKAKVDVSGASAAKAKLEAQKKAAAQAKAKAQAQGNKAANLRAKIKAPLHAPTANIRAGLNANVKAKKNLSAEAKASQAAAAARAAAARAYGRQPLNAKTNATASFKVPPPDVSMKLYGEGYAKLSAEEKLRVRAERRAAHWAAFKAKHQAKITVDRPKMLAPTFHAEFKVNAQRIAKLQRIRFLAEGKKQAKLVAKADALIEKENARHDAKLARLVEGKADVEGEANVAADVKAKGAVNANEKAKANANENSAVKKAEGN